MLLKLEEIVKRLEDRNLKLVAERTGLAHQTLYRIRNGQVTSPNYETVTILSEYLTVESD